MAPSPDKHVVKIIGKIYEQMLRAVRETEGTKERNIILYVGRVYGHILDAIRQYQKKHNLKYRVALIYDSKAGLDDYTKKAIDHIDIVLPCDTTSPTEIQKTLLPYQDEIAVVSCRAEDKIPTFARIIPHLPYLLTPTSESLSWASDKILMRERFLIHNPEITPSFTIVEDDSKASIKKIEEHVGFPLVVKPSGLAASRLVSICYHTEELEAVLKRVFKTIQEVHQTTGGKWEPRVLVEKFLEGEMYSIDAYVSQKGKISFCPMVHVKTGKQIGFDDFFGYQQMTPTLLSKESIMTAELIAQETIYALGMRSTTMHIELMKTEDGWKIVEVGARVGGFRHMMYDFSYDINHTMNDLLIRMGEKPMIPKKINGYTVAMKFFAKEEGKLVKLSGTKKIQDFKSFRHIYVNKDIGDQCTYAKHGGSSVFDLIMFHKDRSELLADIRRVEQTVSIETESK